MPKYTDEPMAPELRWPLQSLVNYYLHSTNSSKPPRDIVENYLQARPVQCSDILRSTLISLRKFSFDGKPRTIEEIIVELMANYFWPYFCEDPRVEVKMCADGHGGQLPRPLQVDAAAS